MTPKAPSRAPTRAPAISSLLAPHSPTLITHHSFTRNRRTRRLGTLRRKRKPKAESRISRASLGSEAKDRRVSPRHEGARRPGRAFRARWERSRVALFKSKSLRQNLQG